MRFHLRITFPHLVHAMILIRTTRPRTRLLTKPWHVYAAKGEYSFTTICLHKLSSQMDRSLQSETGLIVTLFAYQRLSKTNGALHVAKS